MSAAPLAIRSGVYEVRNGRPVFLRPFSEKFHEKSAGRDSPANTEGDLSFFMKNTVAAPALQPEFFHEVEAAQ